jgi:hypothetical protein
MYTFSILHKVCHFPPFTQDIILFPFNYRGFSLVFQMDDLIYFRTFKTLVLKELLIWLSR